MEDGSYSVEHLIRLIYDSASDNRNWPATLAYLQQCMGASAAGFSEYDFTQKQGSFVQHTGFDPAYIRSYEQIFSRNNPWMVDGPWYSEGAIKLDRDIISHQDQIESLFFKRWLQPQGLFHRLCGVIKRDRDQIILVEIMRSRPQGEFSDPEVRLLTTLLPHLVAANQRNTHFWRLVVSLDIINALPFAVLAVDKNGRVLFSNRIAEETLEENKGFVRRHGEIFATASRTSSQLREMISRAARNSAGKGGVSGGAMMIPRGRGMQPLWVVISPLNRRLRRIVGQELEVALLFASSPEHVGRMQETALRSYFGLTAAEQRLAMLILKGYRLNEAAEKLHVSHNTVRSHMKRIYIKTKTECQTDLVRVLLCGPLGAAALQDVG